MSSAIDRYEIGPELGRGGMAVVHLAHDRVLDRPVALKVLNLVGGPEGAAATRFMQEARIIAGLQHPNIVAVHDYIDHAGAAYIVMDYMAGGSVGEYVGYLTLAQVGGVLDAVLSALNEVSRCDPPIVHRDLKPANLLVSGNREDVKVADFGIARVRGQALTRTGVAIGTGAYMAPEQWQAAGSIDQRADLYAVGVIAYELLTGTVPFSADDVAAVGLQHVHAPPEDPRERVAGIDAELAAWTLRLLAKDPDARFQSAEEAQAELRAILGRAAGADWWRHTRLPQLGSPNGHSAAFRGTTSVERPTPTTNPIRRRRGPMIVAAAVCALAASAGVLLLAPWDGDTPAPDEGGAAVNGTPTPAPGVKLEPSDAHVSVQLPPGWKRVRPVPKVPGLNLTKSQAAAPDGKPDQGAVIVGLAGRSANRPELIGPALGERLSTRPARTELAGDVAAYRYYAGDETVYVAPTTAGVVTVVCRKLAGTVCANVASSVELVGADGFPLGASATFARAVNGALKGIATDRKALQDAGSATEQAEAAGAIEKEFESAREQLTKLNAVSPADVGFRDALADATADAESAYRELATAATAVNSSDYASAGKAANHAEKAAADALRDMRAHGYRERLHVKVSRTALPGLIRPPTTPSAVDSGDPGDGDQTPGRRETSEG